MKFLIVFFLIVLPLFGVAPNLIPIQGILTENNGIPINGNVNLTLSLYDSQTSVDELWREERENFPVEKGYISLYLGEITELTPSIVSNANELWLEIIFNNEKIPRIRLASVPYALEAINVQKAKQIGDITGEQISNMFNSTCSDGYYIQKYNSDGNPICKEDKVDTADTNVVYNAGYGINIDEDNNISVAKNLYGGEDGIKVENNIISIDYTKVSSKLHNHDDIYYKKVDNAQNNHLVKYSQDGITNSDISEVDGEVTMKNLTIDNNGTFSVLDITTLKTNKIKGISNGNNLEIVASPVTITGDIISNNDLTLDGKVNVIGKLITTRIISNEELIVSDIKLKVNNAVKFVMSRFQVMNYIDEVDVDAYYILNDGSLSDSDNDSDNALTRDNAFCSISMSYISMSNRTSYYNKCRVYLDSDNKWKISVFNENGNWADVVCKAGCLKWN